MWLSAKERHKHRQALCKWLLHNCNPCEECNIRVVLMVHIRHHIPDAKQWKPEAGEASVIYNAMHRRNKRQGIIATTREVCNATSRLGDGSRLILRQRVQCSARAVRAVRNTQVFQTETRVVADVPATSNHLSAWHPLLRDKRAQSPSPRLALGEQRCCLQSPPFRR
jgi:hypothetical protein